MLAAIFAGCTFVPDPLRAGWLRDGVYPHPPPVCEDTPRRTYDELVADARPIATATDLDVQIDVPLLGALGAHLQAAGSVAPGMAVSTRATRPYRVLDARANSAQVPGFAYRVDLRTASRIAFVADNSGWACRDYVDCRQWTTRLGPAPPVMRREGDQIDAAVAGLRADQGFVVVTGSATRAMTWTPTTAFGRSLAGQFVRGQVCSGQRGVRPLLIAALETAPDVIVLMTDGAALPPSERGYEDRAGGCATYPDDLDCQVDAVTGAVDVAAIAGGHPLPPVIAISVLHPGSRWLQNLAEATGGVYLDALP